MFKFIVSFKGITLRFAACSFYDIIMTVATKNFTFKEKYHDYYIRREYQEKED